MSFFSGFLPGIFGRIEDSKVQEAQEEASMEMEVETRKRGRGSDRRTPTLVAAHSSVVEAGDTSLGEDPPAKRRRGVNDQTIPVLKEDVRDTEKKEEPCYFKLLPEDTVAHVLSFCSGVEDRFALQCTNKQFKRISNSDEMRIGIQVGGDKKTGLHGIITETDTPASASVNLTPFARAGNLEAIYMLGIIKCYCNKDVQGGISLLRNASGQGYVRASYALGLILRDTHPEESDTYMKIAADAGYIPALQETLSARTMKQKYGEPQADQLRIYLDPICLNRLLTRHYVRAAGLRDLNTSHCWNPLCGRWACKASIGGPHPNGRHRRRAHPWLADGRQRNGGLGGAAAAAQGNGPGASDNDQTAPDARVSRMKMCSRCCRAKYCSKLCQVYDWRSGRHKMECQFL